MVARISEGGVGAGALCLLADRGYRHHRYRTRYLSLRHEPEWYWTVVAALLIAVAAVMASAQFPIHGWLTEVMEAPTPVSALLHAGVINAGGISC